MTLEPLFSTLSREHGFESLRIEGVLPAELRGTLYRVGPAASERFGHRYQHWFDGDGAVTAVRFDGAGGAVGAVRFVQTSGRLEEERAGRVLYPTYATLPPGARYPMPRPKPAANTSLLAHADRLFALYEAGAPMEITRELGTVGVEDFGLAHMREGFSAHPHSARGAIYNFGLRFGDPTRLALYELRDGHARELGTVALAGPTLVHDFAVTERHLVFFIAPLRVDVARFAKGLASYGDSLRWRPELGSEVIVVPIDHPSAAVRFSTDPFFHWHVASAREHAGAIVVDFVRYPDFASNQWKREVQAGGTLTRAVIDPAKRSLHAEPRADVAVEFPVADGDLVYAVAEGNRLCRIDASTGSTQVIELGADQYPSEPVLAGRWLLALTYDAQRELSYVAVLDTRRLDAAPVARVWLDHAVPFTLHGLWSEAADHR